MTNEDITKELTRMRKNFDPNSVYGSYCIDCLDAAIEALKEQQEHSQNTSSKQPDLETLGVKTGETCEDVISRQAAIDVVRRCSVKEVAPAYMLIDKAEVMTELMMLPSAQPEIVRCKDCRWRKDQSGSTAWLPCRVLVTPEDFYCGRAERRTNEVQNE